MLHLLRTHEALAALHGARVVAGVDETGVGAIAGPIVAAAVVLPESLDGEELLSGDAKSLPRDERRAAFGRIERTPGLLWSCGAIWHDGVDRLGASGAAHAAMEIAAARLERRLSLLHAPLGAAARPITYLVDGERLPPALEGRAIVRGDQSELCIAAASVVASMAHDAALRSLARRWPLWDLDVNGGWPSRQHLRRIVAHGPSPCHRASCFPFQRRHGRRMAYHPDRGAYRQVQAGLERAAAAGAHGEPPREAGPADEAASDADREQRYRDFYPRAAGAAASPVGRAAAGQRAGQRAERRRRKGR